MLRSLGGMRRCCLLLQSPTALRCRNQQQQRDVVEMKTNSNPFARESPPALATLAQYTANEQSGGEVTGKFIARDEEEERRYKVLQLEVSIASQEGKRVPSLDFLKQQHWEHILSLSTKSARQRYYGYLWQLEKRRESSLRKKQQRQLEAAERMAKVRQDRENNTHIIYGLGHVSMFLRIYESTIDHWMNAR